jgi:branched-chain amino acid transport system substrate-binding protein
MPLTGLQRPRGIAIRDAVRLAIDDANADLPAQASSSRLELVEFDDPLPDPGVPRAVQNAEKMIRDSRTIAMIGPWASFLASETIPLTNRAGLLQCGPSTTIPELTKPEFGADRLRSARPEAINFLRIPATDDVQAPALASFAFNDLSAKTALVVDDGGEGKGIADTFEESYRAIGGRTVRRSLGSGDPLSSILFPLSDPSDPPGVVFFGGFIETGGPELRAAMASEGHAAVSFLSWDGILYGQLALAPLGGDDPGSFIAMAGPAAAGSYAAHVTLAPASAAFADRYLAAFGGRPDEYAPAGYACVQIVAEALRASIDSATDAAALRESVRAYAVDPSRRYDTVIGTLQFDENGDSRQQFVSFYRVEPGALGGKGDWVVFKQQDFGSS